MQMHVFHMGYVHICVFLCGDVYRLMCFCRGSVYTHVYKFSWRPDEVFRSSGLGVTAFCELPDLMAGAEFRS